MRNLLTASILLSGAMVWAISPNQAFKHMAAIPSMPEVIHADSVSDGAPFTIYDANILIAQTTISHIDSLQPVIANITDSIPAEYRLVDVDTPEAVVNIFAAPCGSGRNDMLITVLARESSESAVVLINGIIDEAAMANLAGVKVDSTDNSLRIYNPETPNINLINLGND